jgi:hypothetical protein
VRDERHGHVRAYPVRSMTGFADGLQLFAKKVERNAEAVFVSSVLEMQQSIKFGSAFTGAPAMPVAIAKYFRAGALRDSVTVRYLSPALAQIFTTKWYAPNVEWNSENHTFTSGGPHGWALSVAAFVRVVEKNARRIAGDG